MLRKLVSVIVVVSLFCMVSVAQTTQSTNASTPAPTAAAQNAGHQARKPALQGFGLEDGTPVKLRTASTISSADAHTGDTVNFEVLEDVMVKDTLVIPKGGIA